MTTSLHPATTDIVPIRLLIAEDEEHLGAILEHFLRGRGYDVTMCRDGRAALQALHSIPFDVALIDIVMPEMDGLEVLRHLQSEAEPPEVIIITGNGTIDTAITAIKLGAYDYISKPYRMAEIDVMVRRAWEKRELGKANGMLRNRVSPLPRKLVTHSASMQDVHARIQDLVSEPTPVVLLGECGAGKSHLARYIHAHSGRARDALVELSARAGKLISVGDLVGYEGTEAGVSGGGALLMAERGTAVIDLHALDESADVALRDALANGWFTRVGGSRRIPLAARVVGCMRRGAGSTGPATLTEGSVAIRIAIPALRDRLEDVELLASELLAVTDGGMRMLGPDAAGVLATYAWPGNVRELGVVLARASLIARKECISAADLRLLLAGGSMSTAPAQGGALDELERVHIEAMLLRCNWHQGRAAAALGISTKTLYRKMRQYGFVRPRKRKLSRMRAVEEA